MNSDRLKRNIGWVSATSIGLGAMLGAGIFVFPGLAGGKAGFLAIVSFLIGGMIALTVAACTAELATAMPNSGGGYFFISRSFGNFWGTVVGISQWIGLVFACAFYLVSFSEYALTFLEELNIHWDTNKGILAFVFTLLLLVLNIVGTKKVGRFQNIMVISLTVILVLIFSYGLVDFFGFSDKPSAFEELAPGGTLSVFTTTALIFTSYLGFVQIANVGSEIKKPSKNLPRSLIWSVVIAIALYIFIMLVCILTFPQEKLQDFGETATIEVARRIMGNWGAVVVVFAGILAALSSANASMMSASRGVFALSNDNIISNKASEISKRFGTPHIALILVALPVAVMLMKSNLEVFAEVASFLHLIIYAGICISLIKLRHSSPIWYVPAFRVPAYKIVAGIGAASCIALVFFMREASIWISLGVLAIATCYYFISVVRRKIKLANPEPFHIDADLINPKVLIPVDITQEKKELPHEILDAMPVSKLLLLGFKKTPEQSESEQSEKKFGEEGEKMLEDIRVQLEKDQVDFDSKLIFSNKISAQINDVINEEELRFVLMLKPISELSQIVIPIYERSQINKHLSTVVYNFYSSRRVNIKILLFIGSKKSSSLEGSLRTALEYQFGSVGIDRNTYEIKLMDKLSRKKIARKITGDPGLVIWAQADRSEQKFFLDLILKNRDEDNFSPTIVILKKNRDNSSE